MPRWLSLGRKSDPVAASDLARSREAAACRNLPFILDRESPVLRERYHSGEIYLSQHDGQRSGTCPPCEHLELASIVSPGWMLSIGAEHHASAPPFDKRRVKVDPGLPSAPDTDWLRQCRDRLLACTESQHPGRGGMCTSSHKLADLLTRGIPTRADEENGVYLLSRTGRLVSDLAHRLEMSAPFHPMLADARSDDLCYLVSEAVQRIDAIVTRAENWP